jgi:hypothetical protein
VKKTAICLALLFARVSFGAEGIPTNLQAALLTKVLSYTQQLGGQAKSAVIIGVLNSGEMSALLKKAAEKSKDDIQVREIKLENINGVNVLYLPAGISAESINKVKAITRAKKILSVSGDPSSVLDQDVTMSFSQKNNKPRILINVTAGKEEGVKFSAKLLKIADLKK